MVAACSPQSDAPSGDDAPVAIVNSGLSTPESVLWDAARNVWYIANINGVPTDKDDNGYIVRVSADGGQIDSLPFINGEDEDITLHAPKGMAVVGDTLWVADIDAVRGFNVVSGTEVASIDLSGMNAIFLNDIAATEDGTLYITDTGIAFDADGGVSHPGSSRVFAIRGRSASEAVVLPAESAANGIAWDTSRDAFIIVGFNTQSIYSWTPGAASVEEIGTGPGGGDGVVVLSDGRIVFSSWADSSLNIFADGATTTLRRNLPAPADIGYDPVREWLAVPLFSDNRVEFWIVPATLYQ